MLTVKPLSGQVAFVQGGSRGIGAAIARRLAQAGTSGTAHGHTVGATQDPHHQGRDGQRALH